MADARKGKQNARRITASLRQLEVSELQKQLSDAQEKLMRDRFSHATASLVDTASLKTTRRQIARIETVIKEKTQGARK